MTVSEELSRQEPARDTLLTVGVFDGVHLGHQHLIGQLKKRALESGLLSAVATFRWHPKAVLSPQTELPYVTTLEERIRLIKGLGVDHVVVLSFTKELSRLPAREFARLLKEHVRMRGLVVGPDFALGRDREGDVHHLRLIGRELGFTVEEAPPFMLDRHMPSSTAIRRALAQGDMEMVAMMLGRRFLLTGTVVHGDHRGGELLGFPTANLSVASNRALPADGIYVTLAHLNGDTYRSVTNIGIRPTFGVNERTVESYLLDFDSDLYGLQLGIEFVKRLRGEVRFSSLEELKAQIERDVRSARETPMDLAA